MAKDGILRVRVPKEDLLSWERRACESGLRFPAWVIRELNRLDSNPVSLADALSASGSFPYDELHSKGKSRVIGKGSKSVPSGKVEVLGEVLAGRVINSVEDIPVAIAKAKAVRSGAGKLAGKVDAGKSEVKESAPRLATNGKLYTGVEVMKFGHPSYEILVDGKSQWTFEKGIFEGVKK